jgi:hypothetical protein
MIYESYDACRNAANALVVGSNPIEGKICFSHFTPLYEVECEELFCKTNLKLKFIKMFYFKF